MAEYTEAVRGARWYYRQTIDNPVEQENVYPLPEAQSDRFAMKIRVEHQPTKWS